LAIGKPVVNTLSRDQKTPVVMEKAGPELVRSACTTASSPLGPMAASPVRLRQDGP
jgi:hypothetical protein